MKDVKIDTITQAFLDYCGDDTDPRTMVILKSLMEHLHAFAKGTQLTHAEWARGLKFVTDAGKITYKVPLPDDLAIGRNATVPYYKVDFNFVLVPDNT